MLDSWVRYEGQVKQRQQTELAAAIIAKVEKELENPKTLKQILDQSVADVESTFLRRNFAVYRLMKHRDRLPEGISSQNSLISSHLPVKYLCNSRSGPIDYPGSPTRSVFLLSNSASYQLEHIRNMN